MLEKGQKVFTVHGRGGKPWPVVEAVVESVSDDSVRLHYPGVSTIYVHKVSTVYLNKEDAVKDAQKLRDAEIESLKNIQW